MKSGRYVGSFSDLKELVGRTDSHDIYKCPYCDTIHGKTSDNDGKLYYSSKKNIGFCFRCESVVFNRDSVFSRDLLISMIENKEDENLSENIEQYNKQKYDLSWTFPALDDSEVRDYLLNKRKLSEKSIIDFDVRGCKSPRLGVVFIDDLSDNITNFFQIRNITTNKYQRHLFIKGAIKPISWINRIDTEKECILCEGFASALSSYDHMDYIVNPLVATGKTITKFQLNQITQIKDKIKSLTICYDGGFYKEALKTAKTLYNLGINVFIMSLPAEKDPNEVPKELFKERFEKRISYSPIRELVILNLLSSIESN